MIQAAVLVKLAYRLSSLYSKHPASKICLLPMKIRQDPPSVKHISVYILKIERYTIQEQ